MKSKQIINLILLVFVGVSVATLVIKQVRNSSSAPENTVDQMAADIITKENQVIAYYFHGNIRCATCNTIEIFSREALNSGFADQLSDESLVWRPVNREQPENENFNEEYELVTSSLVLVKIRNGEQAEWKNLGDVWNTELLTDKDKFIKYVQEEITQYLESN
ncbi:MAG: hypothetical protein GY869_10635 [Planctomycetes bacterium]|nr:hypothetical protein [Planctomycetota bacterium]